MDQNKNEVEDKNQNTNLRSLIDVNITISEPNLIKIMSYNILNCASANPNFMGYVTDTRDLDFKLRGPKIVEEIHFHSPDIICLQEVDGTSFPFLDSKLRHKYDGKWTMKTGGKTDGCATFWDNQKWYRYDLIELEYDKCDTQKTNNIAQIFILAHLYEDIKIVVSNTHLLWDLKHPIAKLVQTEKLIKKLKSFSDLPTLICGDFNSNFESEVCKNIVKNLEVLNAYENQNSNHFSIFPRSGENFEVIDHIFYSKKFFQIYQIVALLEKGICSSKLPSKNFPSDHCSLVVNFHLIDTK